MLRTILSIGRWQIIALMLLECGVSNAKRRCASAHIVGARRRQILMGGAAECWRLRWWTIVGVSRGYLVGGDGCKERETMRERGRERRVSVKSSQTRSRNQNRLRHPRRPGQTGWPAKNESGNAAQRGSMHDGDNDGDVDDSDAASICNCCGEWSRLFRSLVNVMLVVVRLSSGLIIISAESGQRVRSPMRESYIMTLAYGFTVRWTA